MKRIICWLLGHRLANDPVGRPFSTRNGVCTRCGKIPPRR
jgi:hypothetical protein